MFVLVYCSSPIAKILSFATIANAQQATEQQKNDFIAACAAGAIKTGCPLRNTQKPDVTEPSVSVQEIQAKNADARAQADKEADKARALLSPTQVTLPAPTPLHVASSAPEQPSPVTVAPPRPITPTRTFITPLRGHTAAQCGPAVPPPGAGWLYAVNRARCLKTAR